jgi:hypothetical protein
MEFSYIIIALFLGLIPAALARSKGRDFLTWYIYGVFLFVIALVHSLILEDETLASQQSSKSVETKTCPFCAEVIKKEAKICRFCQRDLPKQITIIPQTNNIKPIKQSSKILERYVGTYKLPTNKIFTVLIEEDNLVTDFENDIPQRLLPKGMTSFSVENSRKLYTFVEKEGNVTDIRITGEGRELLAKKIPNKANSNAVAG